MEIKVKNSGFINLQIFRNFPDGDLFVGEANKNIPFKIKRVYFINNFANKKAVRGLHAHKKLTQVIFCIKGSFRLHLDDGYKRQTIKLRDPSKGIILGPGLWHKITDISKDCVILVLASDLYKESDYIRDYKEFLKFIKKKK